MNERTNELTYVILFFGADDPHPMNLTPCTQGEFVFVRTCLLLVLLLSVFSFDTTLQRSALPCLLRGGGDQASGEASIDTEPLPLPLLLETTPSFFFLKTHVLLLPLALIPIPLTLAVLQQEEAEGGCAMAGVLVPDTR